MRESSCGGEKVEASLSEHSEKAQCSIIKTLLGTTPMEIEQQKPPDMSARQRTNELIKLIRKLRWIGMEEGSGAGGDGAKRRLACGQRARVAAPY
jgi:hypothetical protein